MRNSENKTLRLHAYIPVEADIPRRYKVVGNFHTSFGTCISHSSRLAYQFDCITGPEFVNVFNLDVVPFGNIFSQLPDVSLVDTIVNVVQQYGPKGPQFRGFYDIAP